MNKLHLIMPMGGSGSRFFKNGYVVPKPLIEIQGKPFFYWATKSISKFIDVDITFVVLQEHINDFAIDKQIKKYFADAYIEVIPKVLNGAVLTCMEGIKHINDDCPIIFNDCDHLFIGNEFYQFCENLSTEKIDGALLTFNSNDPKFSFLELSDNGNVIRTVEKVVISNHAICGVYYFKDKEIFKTNVEQYLEKCNYSEYFVSGVYNEMAENKLIIKNFTLDKHLSFGTPEEYEEAKNSEYFKDLM